MPFTNYDDMILLINFLVGVSFILRGGKKQANLLWSYFRFSRVTSGKYTGHRKLVLQVKTMSISVKNPTRRDNTGLNVVKCTKNINTCVVYWVNLYHSLCPPIQKRFYCYNAHARLLKVSL